MLRAKIYSAALVWLMAAAGAAAQEGPPRGDAPEGSPAPEAAVRDNAIGQFDADGDGQLIGEELGRARAFLQALRGVVGDRGREGGPRGGDARDGGRRRPMRGDGPDRRGGPPQYGEAPPWEGGGDARPPRPGVEPDEARDGDGPRRPPGLPRGQAMMRLFEEFDGDSNGELSREEFAELMGALRERRGPGGPGGPGGPSGPGVEGGPARGFGAAPEEGRPPRGARGRGRGFNGLGGPAGRRPPRDDGARAEFDGAPAGETSELPPRPDDGGRGFDGF